MKPSRQRTLLHEDATAVAETLVEARQDVLVEAVAGQPGRYRVEIINPGWGSSGYYSAAVLAEAAERGVFAEGVHMYADHPSESDRLDRPERSVRDLWGVLTSPATVGPGGGLIAEAQVFAPYRPLVDEMHQTIGLSIRGTGSFEMGEAEGRAGRIITGLDEALSVDFVTNAGRGGRILQLLESARGEALTAETARAQLAEARNVGQWIESRLHLELTRIADDMFGEGRLTREERISLSGAVGDGLQAFTAALEASAPQLYARDLWADPVALATVEATTNVPVIPAGQSTSPTESEEDTMPQIEESRLAQLEADAGRVQTLEAERTAADQRAQAAERELAESRARDNARPIVASVLAAGERQLPAPTAARITESLVAACPLTDTGALDEAALRTATATAVTGALAEIDAVLAEATPRLSGFGASATVTEADTEARNIARSRAGLTTTTGV